MYRRLTEGGGVEVGVWECPHRGPGWCGGEVLDAAEVVIPIRGAWVQEGTTGEHVASPATAMLGSPGDEYRVRHPAGGGDRSVVFLVRDEALEDLGRALEVLEARGSPRFRRSRIGVSPSAFLSVHRLLARIPGPPPDSLEAGGRILEALEAVTADAGPRGPRGRPRTVDSLPRHRKAVLRALELLVASFRERLTLEEVARAAGYSPFHFARIFRSVTGSTIHGRLNELRLRWALDRIRDGEPDLTRVALGAGFSSHSHFTHAFRVEFAITPSQARKLA